jgi:MoxR-like ATPase
MTNDIRTNIESAIVEMGSTHKERLPIIKGLWVSLIARQHLLMLGPGGTGKSFLCRDLADRIDGSTYFETALDETSDPGQVFGPVDIKAMKEEGKHKRRTDGMLPEADIAFIDEFFNANGPTLHGMMPILNERLFHNNGHPSKAPLWSAFMGTNKLNADTDQAATWDRVHQRWVVKYVQDRDNVREMVAESIARRIRDHVEPARSSIKLEQLKDAHDEAMQLDIPDATWETFLDIKDELLHNGVEVSSRRQAEGMAAVLANAWLNGHDSVTIGDLDILQAMWWTLQADIDVVQKLILGATNPGEKAALEFLDELEKYNSQLQEAERQDLDDTKKRLIGMEVFKNSRRIIAEANELETKAKAAGAGTARIEELRGRTQSLMDRVQEEFFGL